MPSATSKQIKIIQDVFPGIIVYADILMIQIVVRNILNNAIKFCNEGCEIIISAVYNEDSKMMTCIIEDNGKGMSQEALDLLTTGTSVSTRGTMNEKGTGLGLVICKDFLERNNGKMRITSRPGKGSQFYLYLPLDKQKE